MIHTTAPAHNTRSQTQKVEKPPSIRTRVRTQITRMENNKQKDQASKVETTIAQLENHVQQVLGVMDSDTGNILNYRQLMQNPKNKNIWSTSSANEFGRLANGVGRRIKTPTNTITLIRRKEIPHNRIKDVTYGQLICSVRPEKKEQNRTKHN